MRKALTLTLLAFAFAFSVCARAQVIGTTLLTVSNPSQSGTSILSGYTVTGCNAISGSVPSGWTLVGAEGFENGGTCVKGTSILGDLSTTQHHSGTHALHALVNSDQSSLVWELSQGMLGNVNELYVSFWEYLDPNALFNDEIELSSFSQNDSSGNLLMEMNFDRFGYSNNTPAPCLVIQPQGNGAGTANEGDVDQNCPNEIVGQWVQWELHWVPNTISSGVSQNNGYMEIYENGQKVWSISPRNLNGPVSMSNGLMFVGGVYTKAVWTNNGQLPPAGTCVNIGNGQGAGGYGLFSSDICPPQPPTFNWYVDDIILLKK